jgi:hypothetical protein
MRNLGAVFLDISTSPCPLLTKEGNEKKMDSRLKMSGMTIKKEKQISLAPFSKGEL